MNRIQKRTFEALTFAKGSSEREKLNEETLTSEYMPSYKYMISDTLYQFKTEQEAEQGLEALYRD